MTHARPGLTRTADRGHEEMGHTADARIHARVSSLAALREDAAAAMADLATVLSATAPSGRVGLDRLDESQMHALLDM